jgi:hypothetical protein
VVWRARLADADSFEEENFLMATTVAHEWYEEQLRQRERKGIEQGVEQEHQKIVAMLVHLLVRRFGPDEENAGALAAIEELDELLAVQKLLLEAESLEEVRRSVLARNE